MCNDLQRKVVHVVLRGVNLQVHADPAIGQSCKISGIIQFKCLLDPLGVKQTLVTCNINVRKNKTGS